MKRILFFMMAVAVLAMMPKQTMAQEKTTSIVTGHPDFKIKIKRCAASGKTVVLDMLFMNEGASDVNGMWVDPTSSLTEIYDDEGNIYRKDSDILQVKVANGDFRYGYQPEFSIIPDVPMKVTLRINNVPTSATSLARVKLLVKCDAWGLKEPVLMRNIPITRD